MFKKMRMRTGSMLLLSGIVLMMSACSNSSNSNAKNKEGESSQGNAEKVVIELWYPTTGDKVLTQAFDEMKALYNESQDKVELKMTFPPQAEYETALNAAISSKTAPDIMAVDAPNIAAYAGKGALEPLDTYYAKNGNPEDLTPPIKAAMTFEGKLYGAPLFDSGLALYVNKKIFEAAGVPLPSQDPEKALSWSELVETAQKLTKNGVWGLAPNPWGFPNHEGRAYATMPFIWQNGGEVLSPDGSTASGFLNSAKSVEAIQWYSDLFNKFKVSPKEMPQDGFPNGKIAMVTGQSSYLNYMEAQYPDFKLGVDYEIVQYPKNVRNASPNGNWSYALNVDSKNKDAAWDVINFLTGKEGAKTWYEKTKMSPARSSTFEAYPELKQYPMNIFSVGNEKYAIPRPVTPVYPQVSKAIGDMFEKTALQGMDPQKAADEAVDIINKAIADNKK